MADTKTIEKLKKLYKVYTPKTDASASGKQVQPGRINDKGKLEPIKFPSDVQKMYEYFMENYASAFVTNRERFMLYKDILFAIKNSGIMFRAMKIYKDETYEIQDGQKPVQIRAKDKKVEKVFYEWLNTIGFNSNLLSEIIENLVIYGDAFWINTIDSEKGIISITCLDPFLVKDKLEFNLSTASKVRQWSQSYLNITNKNAAMDELVKVMTDDKKVEDFSLYFKSYNMGYILKYAVEDDESSQNFKAVPPWGITHCRLFTTSSEFFPFGRPLFIYSIAVYRGYKTTEMLIDMLRASSFPREVVEIQGSETMTPLDRVIRVNEVRELIENMSPVTNNRDMMGVGDRIYTMEGLFKFDLVDPDVDLGRLGDLENKRQDLILTTGIPDTILIPSEGTGLGGESASAVLYQNKLFQRNVESIKGAFLEGITETFRTHLAITDQFDGETTEFELFMPVNAEAYSGDKIDNMQASFELASDIMNNLAQVLGMERGDSLPEDVIIEILQNFISIDPHLLNRWVSKIKDSAEEQAEDHEGEGNDAPFIVSSDGSSASKSSKKRESFIKSKNSVKRFLESTKNEKVKRFLESYLKGDDSIIREAYFNTKRELGMKSGIFGKHYYYNNTYEIENLTENNKFREYSQFGLLRKAKIGNTRKRLQE